MSEKNSPLEYIVYHCYAYDIELPRCNIMGLYQDKNKAIEEAIKYFDEVSSLGCENNRVGVYECKINSSHRQEVFICTKYYRNILR